MIWLVPITVQLLSLTQMIIRDDDSRRQNESTRGSCREARV